MSLLDVYKNAEERLGRYGAFTAVKKLHALYGYTKARFAAFFAEQGTSDSPAYTIGFHPTPNDIIHTFPYFASVYFLCVCFKDMCIHFKMTVFLQS